MCCTKIYTNHCLEHKGRVTETHTQKTYKIKTVLQTRLCTQSIMRPMESVAVAAVPVAMKAQNKARGDFPSE